MGFMNTGMMVAHNPKIPLKRLALLYCHFPLHASVLVDAFRASGAKELERDEYVPQWEGRSLTSLACL
jgi:hypothetical protein